MFKLLLKILAKLTRFHRYFDKDSKAILAKIHLETGLFVRILKSSYILTFFLGVEFFYFYSSTKTITKGCLVRMGKQQRSDVHLSERLASLDIMRAPSDHHSTIVLRSLRGGTPYCNEKR